MTLPPMPPLPEPLRFEPSGECRCAGPHQCEACQENERDYREWRNAPGITPQELYTYAEQYGRLCAEAERSQILALVESFQRQVSPVRGKQIADAIRARGQR